MYSSRHSFKKNPKAIWWIDKSIKVKRSQTAPDGSNELWEDLRNFFLNVSMPCYDKLASLNPLERFLWFIVHLTTLTIMLISINYIAQVLYNSGPAIQIHDPYYPMKDVTLPTVTLCPHIRISLHRATIYAKYLSQRDPLNRTEEYFLEKLKLFRLFFSFETNVDEAILSEFANFLDTYATEQEDQGFNTPKVLKQLATSCDELIKICHLNWNPVDCFGKDMFHTTYNSNGMCCSMILQKSFINESANLGYTSIGFEFSVQVYTNESDDFYSPLNTDGITVFIHNKDLPISESTGGIKQFNLNNDEVRFIGISARKIISEPGVRKYPWAKRDCYFDDEPLAKRLVVHGNYSRIKCLLKCLARNVGSICGCHLHYIPKEYFDAAEIKPFCSLFHYMCINRNIFKWHSIQTNPFSIENVGELATDLAVGMYCIGCRSRCEYVQYMSNIVDISELSEYLNRSGVVFTLQEDRITIYKYVESYTWNNLFINFGNISSIYLGFSMVALLEIIYFVIKYGAIVFKSYLLPAESKSKPRKIKPKQLELIIRP